VRARRRERGRTAKELVPRAVLADLLPQRRREDPLVDRQVSPVRHLLAALLHAADLVEQEALEVEDEDGRERVELDVLGRVLRDAARRNKVGQRLGRRQVAQCVLDAEDVLGLQAGRSRRELLCLVRPSEQEGEESESAPGCRVAVAGTARS